MNDEVVIDEVASGEVELGLVCDEGQVQVLLNGCWGLEEMGYGAW